MTRFDLISIGSISIDLYFKGSSFTLKNNRYYLALGGKYFADSFYEGIGGGGANVAIGVRKHNLKTAVCGKIGENVFKPIIFKKLNQAKIGTELCLLEKNYLNISSILLSEKGERTIINFQTPHQHLLGNNKNLLIKLTESKMVYFGNLPDVSLTERIRIARFIKNHHIPLAINIGVSDCRRPISQISRFIQYGEILILNTHEFAELIKTRYEELDFKKNPVRKIEFLKNKMVIITDAAKGSYGYYKNKVYYHPPLTVKKIIDSTGAGDAYTAGFLSLYLKTANLEKAMEQGTRYAAKILTRIGAN